MKISGLLKLEHMYAHLDNCLNFLNSDEIFVLRGTNWFLVIMLRTLVDL